MTASILPSERIADVCVVLICLVPAPYNAGPCDEVELLDSLRRVQRDSLWGRVW